MTVRRWHFIKPRLINEGAEEDNRCSAKTNERKEIHHTNKTFVLALDSNLADC